MFFFQRASPPWCYLHVNIFLPSSIVLPQTLWGTVQYLQTMLIFFLNESFKIQKMRSKQRRKQGREEAREKLWVCLYRICFDTVSLLHEFFHMLLSDPLLKATEPPKAHFVLCAYVAGQPLLNQSVSPEAKICNPERWTCEVEAFGQRSNTSESAKPATVYQYQRTVLSQE